MLLLAGLFLVDINLRLSPGGHEAFQLGSLMLVVASVSAWLRRNRSALDRLEDDTYARTITILEFVPGVPRVPTMIGDRDHLPSSAVGIPEDASKTDPIAVQGQVVETQPALAERTCE